MSAGIQASPRGNPLETLLYGLLIGASAVNLGTNLFADLAIPEGESLPGWMLWLLWGSKPLIVPVLTGILVLSTRRAGSSILQGPIYYLALLFCWFGDIALLLPPKPFFQIGLGAFGVAHLCFIRANLKGIDWRSVLDRRTLVHGLPFLVYGYTLYSVIYYQKSLEDSPILSLAIGGYMVVLLSHGMSAFIRMRLNHTKSSSSILVGIVLFAQSDSIIAVNDFVQRVPLDRFAIMATYILGLFLMIRGCILDCEESPQQQPEAWPARARAAA